MADAPGQPPVVVESAQTHTPPDPHVGPSCLRKHTPRNYDNDGRTSHRLRRRARYSMLRPMRMARRVVSGVAPVRSNTTS